jgi:hypothetical protein
MNRPTTAITDAMLQAARQASDWVADLRDEEISHIYLAMQSATPSTPELEELVERLDELQERAESIASSDMSIQAQTNAIALLFTLNLPLFRQARAALSSKGGV